MIFIKNGHKLWEDIERYKRMFPNSYMSYDQVKAELEENEDMPNGQVFGISVAKEWPDKCYGFEVDSVTPSTTTFLYLGLWKC